MYQIKMDNRDFIRTGDAILFSGNTPTGFLLKTFTSSDWNHSGIAVRLKKVNGELKVSLTNEGKLYVLETNISTRYDDYFKEKVVGVGFTRAEWEHFPYNKVSVRRIHDIFRTQRLADLTIEFAKKIKGTKFPSGKLPFISAWFGFQIGKDTDDMFCSEMMAHYYDHCVGGQYEEIIGNPYTGDLEEIFGKGAPQTRSVCTPNHYTQAQTPHSPIFNGREIGVWQIHADLFYVIIQPIILIMFLMLVIWMSLPR